MPPVTAIAICVWMQFDADSMDGGLFSWRGAPAGGALLAQGGGYLKWDVNTSITSRSSP